MLLSGFLLESNYNSLTEVIGLIDWAPSRKFLLYEAEDHLCYHIPTFDADPVEWANVQQQLKAYLCLYMSSGVYSQITNEFAFPTIKDRWDKLKHLYSGNTGSTTVFNNWIALTQACLDENQPLGPQLMKLNEACVNLANAKMSVSDTQYCFILLCALPESYEMLTSTILTLSDPTNLHPSDIVTCIQNEEGHRNGRSTSLNAITPIRGKAMAKLPPVKGKSMPILLAITAIRKGTLSLIAEREKRMRQMEKRRIKRVEVAPRL